MSSVAPFPISAPSPTRKPHTRGGAFCWLPGEQSPSDRRKDGPACRRVWRVREQLKVFAAWTSRGLGVDAVVFRCDPAGATGEPLNRSVGQPDDSLQSALVPM